MRAVVIVLGGLLGMIPICRPLQAQAPVPAAPAQEAGVPINLATALRLANVRPLDIALATHRLEAEAARWRRAKVLWVPSITLGGDYYRHDGPLQRAEGEVVEVSRSTTMVGVGPQLILSTSDALFEPLAARQSVVAREADVRTASNDALLAVAEAYMTMQQARGEYAGALANWNDTLALDRIINGPSKEFAPPPSLMRCRVETHRRRIMITTAKEREQVVAAELCRLLHLDPTVRLAPLEPPELSVTLVEPSASLPELVQVAVMERPELAARTAQLRAAAERVRQEKLRPLLPNVMVRPNSTTPTNSLGFGWFGGGRGSRIGSFGLRGDIDLQVLWEFQQLGLGNRARQDERMAEERAALVEYMRQQDRVASEVTQALAQVQSAAARSQDAAIALKESVELVRISLEGVQTTRKSASGRELIVRPQEVVAAIQARGQAITDYYTAISDYNRAQFRLYRALGYPAQYLAESPPMSERPAVGGRVSTEGQEISH